MIFAPPCRRLLRSTIIATACTPTPMMKRLPRLPRSRCARALAIQLIINQEWGLAKNENPSQGAFVIDELTDLVEEAVLQEFEKISDRGGVLGAHGNRLSAW